MELGDLVVETELVEIVPAQRSCVCSDHERVGATFHLVKGCMYKIVINVFREGAAQQGSVPNPVSAAHHITLTTQGGTPVKLALQPTPVAANKGPLPQCISFAAVWDPVQNQSATLLKPTKWPETRKVDMEISMELRHLPNQPQAVSAELYFQVHAKESVGMKAKRAKEWAKEEYLKLKPSTRAAISGSVTVVKLAGRAAMF